MNIEPLITDLAQTGIDKVGWIADLATDAYVLPGLMLCPSNPGRQTQSWGRALSLPEATAHYLPAEFRRLRDELGYNSNYCQSWYMIHTQYDGASAPVFDPDPMYGSIGPLRSTMMSNAGASRVPLLGDARTPRDEVFDHTAQGYGEPVRETKSATDGPGWEERFGGFFTAAPYSSLTPYGVQDWDDFGPAHR